VLRSINGLALLIVFAIFSAQGCASVQQVEAKTNAKYTKVWKACLDSLADVQFSATSTDLASGLIVADQAVVSGHGTVSRLNITVIKASRGITVTVKFVPPPMTIGGQGTADAYIQALKQRIPDLKVMVSN